MTLKPFILSVCVCVNTDVYFHFQSQTRLIILLDVVRLDRKSSTMGGMYSTEDMEKQMLSDRLLKNGERSTFDRIRIPFKLLCDNATQTDVVVDHRPKCSCSDGGRWKKESEGPPPPPPADESHINFTSIYLSCHNTPSKCFCENFVQTDPVSVTSLAVQTESTSIGVGYRNVVDPSPTDVSDTTDSEVYEDTVSYRPGFHQQWSSKNSPQQQQQRHSTTTTTLHHNATVSLKYEVEYKQNNDVVLQLDPIDGKYISSLSEDESLDEGKHYRNDAIKTNDYYSRRTSSYNRVSENGHDLDDDLTRGGSDYFYDNDLNTEAFDTACNYESSKRAGLSNFESMKRELPTTNYNKSNGNNNHWKRYSGNYEVVRRNRSDTKNNNKWKRHSAYIERTANIWENDDEDIDANKGYLSDDNYTRKRQSNDNYDRNKDITSHGKNQLIKRDGSGCNLDRFTDQETGIEEEFEIRHMLDVDYCWKCESLQQENKSIKETVTQYEHVIKELSDQSEDLMLTDATLNDAINEKEQLQLDLNKAESSLMDAYKRIERLKSALDKYKHNESTMKVSLYDFQTKLSKSEERYKKLKQQAIEKVDAANTEIVRVRKEKEMEVATSNSAFQKCRNRNLCLEKELEQKTITNKELSQICDELIKKVSDE